MDLERSDSPNMTTHIIPADEAEAENDVGSSSSSSSTSCGSQIAEVLVCLIPVPIGILTEFYPAAYERPIPYQTVEGDDGDQDIIRSLVYDNPETGETVSSVLMFALGIAVPLVLQIGLAFCVKKTRAERLGLIQKIICVYAMAIGLTHSITNLSKLYVGYLRPIFFEMCQPDGDYQECTGEHSSEGRKSFPSGHASLSTCGLLLFSLFLEDSFGKTAYRKSRTKPHKFVRIVSVLCYTPMLLAFFIFLSRVHDNYHHPADVIGGALLGGSIASLIFDIWFS